MTTHDVTTWGGTGSIQCPAALRKFGLLSKHDRTYGLLFNLVYLVAKLLQLLGTHRM